MSMKNSNDTIWNRTSDLNPIILREHRRICGPSLTETWLCRAYLYIEWGKQPSPFSTQRNKSSSPKWAYLIQISWTVSIVKFIVLLTTYFFQVPISASEVLHQYPVDILELTETGWIILCIPNASKQVAQRVKKKDSTDWQQAFLATLPVGINIRTDCAQL